MRAGWTQVNRTLLLTLACSLVLAGCATPDNGNDNGGTTAQVSNEDALRLLTAAGQEFPNRFGFEFRAFDINGTEMLVMKGGIDNATKTSYMEVRGDAAAFGEEAGQAGDLLTNGFSLYSTPEGSLYIINDTAYTFPPDDDKTEGGMVPSPSENPFEELVNPEQLFSEFGAENVTIVSVKPVTYRGKGAVEIAFTVKDDSENVNGKMVFFQNPTRVAYFEADGPIGKMDKDASTSGETFDRIAKFAGDFYYEDAKIDPPANAKRALGLAYESDGDAFNYNDGSDSENKTTTWTFLSSGGIALNEVEIQAKESSGGGGMGPGSSEFATMTTLWSMKLSEGTATHDATTVTFNDKDGDGKLSKGDTLTTVTTGDGAAPTLVLHDTVTGLYVVPGFAPLLGMLALLGVALILRRR